MDLFEYQAKQLFAAHGVPVGLGEVADTPEQARQIAERLGGIVVVKAQVKTGGRGKAGGVKVAKTPDEAFAAAEAILGMDIKGHTVHRVLVDPGASIEQEYYFSYLLDRSNRTFLAMASAEGGMEIEQLAVERPEALAKVPIDASTGVDAETARRILTEANFPAEVTGLRRRDRGQAVGRLRQAGRHPGRDQPAGPGYPVGAGSTVLALDGKVSLDDNANFRQPGNAEFVDVAATDPLEAGPRRSTSTTSSWTARSASSATAPAW